MGGWGGDKKEAAKKPFGVELRRMTADGGDVENGGLPEGETYFAGVLYGWIVEVFPLGTPPPGGWLASRLVPPLQLQLKGPFSGEVLDDCVLAPVGASGGVAGFGNAAGTNVELKAEPIPGDLHTHVLWVGPHGWQAVFRGGTDNRLEKVPTVLPVEGKGA
jgi:hypothetical protein